MDWEVSIDAPVWAEGNGDDSEDDRPCPCREGTPDHRPDAGLMDLFDTLDAVDQQLANVAEMLTFERPDLMPNAGMELGGDLMVLSSLWINPRFRGHKLGHAVLKAILGTVGRATSLVVLEAAPILADDGPMEGSPEHTAAKKALQLYWADYGFQVAAGDYLVLFSDAPAALFQG